eukprot:TRINITY_DN74523_c0_g1_i1.p1 TRINITY_DN74523_c0_g1~~TRINITY_DN74523_c0_g1_i1.p1  ORF type:complete len:637 (+),score=113.00 TRINITY_DN74523_c0_g1_i1:48-1913(+)
MTAPIASELSASSLTTAAPWVEDGHSRTCMRCNATFQLHRRRHHCRQCGYLICGKCSHARQLVPEYHPTRPQRVCTHCAVPSQSRTRTSSLTGESAVAEDSAAVAGGKPLKIEALTGAVPSGRGSHFEFGTLHVRVVEARGLIAADRDLLGRMSKSDPYCLIRLGSSKVVKTRTVEGTLHPRWDVSVSFRAARREEPLYLELWDEDLTNADDFLGGCELRIDSLRDGATFSGWLPLVSPADHHEQAGHGVGAVFIEVSLEDVQPSRYFRACVLPLEALPAPPPNFDIDAVYGPAMHIVDLMWSRFLSPMLFAFLDLIFWKNPCTSAMVLVTWLVGARCFLEHWPALFFLALACYVLRGRGAQRKKTGAATAKSAGAVDRGASGRGAASARGRRADPAAAATAGAEASGGSAGSTGSTGGDATPEGELGRTVQRLCYLLPAWVKELCQTLQPLLRMGADALQTVHDLFTWQHSGSAGLVCALLLLSLLCELVSISTQVMAFGSVLMLACSPVVTFVRGLVTYVQLARTPPTQVPAGWPLQNEYAPEWDSKDYILRGVQPTVQRSMVKAKAVAAFINAGNAHAAARTSAPFSPRRQQPGIHTAGSGEPQAILRTPRARHEHHD